LSAIGELAEQLRERLVEESQDLSRPGGGDRVALKERIGELVREQAGLLSRDQREELLERILSSTLGLGRLEPLMDDPTVDEIMVNGVGAVLVERGGRIERTEITFESERELLHMVERILSPLGRRVDEASPLVDARLADGSRVNCVIAPLSLQGPVVTIRRFRSRGFTLAELVESGSLTADLVTFLTSSVRARLNVVVSGGTGSGKTTLLNVLSSLIAGEQRIITIEDAAELRLGQEHVVRLESRPPNLEGRGEVTVRTLVKNALRMRPDRIIVGEVRGAEALDMLQALNTGHDGSMTTIHANSAADALRRVETLALMADVALPHSAIREQIASALDLIVHLERGRDGVRRVVSAGEVVRVGGEVGVRELYSMRGGHARLLAAPTDALATTLANVT
jgi:pilus assembly protein CpaF